MPRLALVVLLPFAVTLTPLARAQEGRLQEMRDDADGKKHDSRPSNSGKGSDSKNKDSDDDGDSVLGSVFGPMIGFVVISPFVLPVKVLEDDYERSAYFRPYPYAGHSSDYIFFDGDPEHPPAEVGARKWSGRLTLDESNDFRGINRVSGSLLLDTTWRLGLQTDWTYLSERYKNEDGTHGNDELLLGDANFVFRFAQHEFAEFRAGLGVRFLSDRDHSRAGFNFTYDADFYLPRPFIFSMQMDGGNVGSAGVFHARATAGVIYERWELYAGYDFMRFGSVNLQGPVFGLRFWF
jgi:hypothetical protein